MSVTLKDIAAQVGVSKQLVSAVLNRSAAGRVSVEKRRLIMEAVRELGYTPNRLAKALTEKRTWTLGFINGDIESPFHAALTAAMLAATEQRGYRLLVLVTQWSREKELSCLAQMRNYQVDGIIMNSSVLRRDDLLVQEMERSNFPFVSIGGAIPTFTCIKPDFLPGMTEAFELLLRTGHRRIAIADASDGIKFNAYCECCCKYGIEPRFFDFPPLFVAGLDPVMVCGEKIAAEPDRPDAIIAGNDEIAAMLIKGLAKNGVKVPDDISMIGHDGTYLHSIVQSTLSDIVFDRNHMAGIAVEHLIAQIENKGMYQPEQIAVPTRLMVYDSVIARNG